MAKMSLRVQINGTIHNLEVRPIDRVKWERHSGRGIMTAFNEKNISEGATMELAWVSARRVGVVSAETSLDDFLEMLDDIDEEAVPVVPFEEKEGDLSQTQPSTPS